jgi:hypothetical protein
VSVGILYRFKEVWSLVRNTEASIISNKIGEKRKHSKKKEARPGLLDVGNSKKIWRKSARVKRKAEFSQALHKATRIYGE